MAANLVKFFWKIEKYLFTFEMQEEKQEKLGFYAKKNKPTKPIEMYILCKKDSWWLTRKKHFVTWLHCKSDGPAVCDVWLLIYQLVLLLYAVRSRVRLIFEFQI